jgi:5-methylcytosine-specific restriction endonuclease McrA
MSVTARKRANNPHQPVGRWIRPERRLAIYLRDGFRCLCGRDLAGVDPWQVTLDHIVPTSRGGSNNPSNLYTCCRRCNTARRDLPLRGVRLRAARLRSQRSLARHLDAARAVYRATGAGAWPRAHRAAGAIARAYRTGTP